MTKKQIHNSITGVSTLVDLTTEEQTIYDNAIATFNADAKNNPLNIALKNLREKRNKLLADSDWEVIMAKEKGTTLSAGFKTYRQDLRDLTEGLTTVAQVEAVVFPTKP
jgi:hypothetical protein